MLETEFFAGFAGFYGFAGLAGFRLPPNSLLKALGVLELRRAYLDDTSFWLSLKEIIGLAESLGVLPRVNFGSALERWLSL